MLVHAPKGLILFQFLWVLMSLFDLINFKKVKHTCMSCVSSIVSKTISYTKLNSVSCWFQVVHPS